MSDAAARTSLSPAAFERQESGRPSFTLAITGVQKPKGEGVKAFSPAALVFHVRCHRQPRTNEYNKSDDLVILDHFKCFQNAKAKG
jgi:hypothetical protein